MFSQLHKRTHEGMSITAEHVMNYEGSRMVWEIRTGGHTVGQFERMDDGFQAAEDRIDAQLHKERHKGLKHVDPDRPAKRRRGKR